MTVSGYSERAAQWAKALKLLDPSLCLILCGETGHSTWDFKTLSSCIPYVDMHSIHIYTYSSSHVPNVIAPLSAERAIETAASLIDIARIERNISPTARQTKICFDEWNVWDQKLAPGEDGAEQLYTLSDALAVGVWLNVFVRQSKYMGMANIAQTVNVISPLTTSKSGIVKQSTWWPLLLFSKYMRGWTVGVHVRSGAYDGVTQPAWLQGVLEQGASWLDVSASVNEQGVLSMVVVNIHETCDFEVELKGVGKDVSVFTITGDNVKATNTAEKEGVVVKESKWDGQGKFTFAKHSLSMLRWDTGKKISEVKLDEKGSIDTRKMAWVPVE
jgi:alpha-N-arabinofuranosidase